MTEFNTFHLQQLYYKIQSVISSPIDLQNLVQQYLISGQHNLFRYLVEDVLELPQFLKVLQFISPDSRKTDMLISFQNNHKKLQEAEKLDIFGIMFQQFIKNQDYDSAFQLIEKYTSEIVNERIQFAEMLFKASLLFKLSHQMEKYINTLEFVLQIEGDQKKIKYFVIALRETQQLQKAFTFLKDNEPRGYHEKFEIQKSFEKHRADIQHYEQLIHGKALQEYNKILNNDYVQSHIQSHKFSPFSFQTFISYHDCQYLMTNSSIVNFQTRAYHLKSLFDQQTSFAVDDQIQTLELLSIHFFNVQLFKMSVKCLLKAHQLSVISNSFLGNSPIFVLIKQLQTLGLLDISRSYIITDVDVMYSHQQQFYLSRCCFFERQITKALDLLQKALIMIPTHIEYRFLKSMILKKQNLYFQSLDLLQQIQERTEYYDHINIQIISLKQTCQLFESFDSIDTLRQQIIKHLQYFLHDNFNQVQIHSTCYQIISIKYLVQLDFPPIIIDQFRDYLFRSLSLIIETNSLLHRNFIFNYSQLFQLQTQQDQLFPINIGFLIDSFNEGLIFGWFTQINILQFPTFVYYLDHSIKQEIKLYINERCKRENIFDLADKNYSESARLIYKHDIQILFKFSTDYISKADLICFTKPSPVIIKLWFQVPSSFHSKVYDFVVFSHKYSEILSFSKKINHFNEAILIVDHPIIGDYILYYSKAVSQQELTENDQFDTQDSTRQVSLFSDKQSKIILGRKNMRSHYGMQSNSFVVGVYCPLKTRTPELYKFLDSLIKQVSRTEYEFQVVISVAQDFDKAILQSQFFEETQQSVVFLPFPQEPEMQVRMHLLVDVYLDFYGFDTQQALNSLFLKNPVVCLRNAENIAQCWTAQYLDYIGLTQFLTASRPQNLSGVILQLLKNPQQIASVKEIISAKRELLFDSKLFVAQLQDALKTVWTRYVEANSASRRE